MRLSIKRKMEENLIKADINKYEEEIAYLIRKSKKLQEFANQCVVHIQDEKTTIEDFSINKIGNIKGHYVATSSICCTNRYKITSNLFKNIDKEQNKISKEIKKHNKKINKLNKKLSKLKND